MLIRLLLQEQIDLGLFRSNCMNIEGSANNSSYVTRSSHFHLDIFLVIYIYTISFTVKHLIFAASKFGVFKRPTYWPGLTFCWVSQLNGL